MADTTRDPATPAPERPDPGSPLGAIFTLALLALVIVLADLKFPSRNHLVEFLILIPILASLLVSRPIALTFLAMCDLAALGVGAMEHEPLLRFHAPLALGILVTGSLAIWAMVRRDESDRAFRHRETEYRHVLNESLSLQKATIESTADGLLVIDRQERVSTMNGRFGEMWRIPPEILATGSDRDLIGSVLSQLKDPEAFLSRVRDLYDHPEEESFDTLQFKDGRIFERYSRPQRIDDRVVGRVWSFRDVTIRRRAEEALEEARSRLERLLSTSPAVIFSVSPEPPYGVTYMSSNVREQLGCDPSDFVTNPHFWETLCLPEDVEARRGWIDRLLEEGRYSDTIRFRRVDGTLIWLQIELRVLTDAEGKRTEVVGSSIDVTARLDAEQDRAALRESLLRSESMSAIGALVAGVAHEVRNPLFAISASLDAFEARVGTRSDDRPNLGRLRSAVDRLSILMQQLLDYGRPPRMAPEAGSLHECVARSIEILAVSLREREVTIVNRIDRDLPPALIDRPRALQVFLNLLENAVQHSPPRGAVTVRAREVEHEGRPGIECRIEDSGAGFKPESIGRIFEPFYSERHGGTGLGLSVVQRIMEQHGGTIAVENRPEGGARIRLWFPRADEAESQAAPGPDLR